MTTSAPRNPERIPYQPSGFGSPDSVEADLQAGLSDTVAVGENREVMLGVSEDDVEQCAGRHGCIVCCPRVRPIRLAKTGRVGRRATRDVPRGTPVTWDLLGAREKD